MVQVIGRTITFLGRNFKVVSTAKDGFGRQWVRAVAKNGKDTMEWRVDDFRERFKEQLPKEQPTQGELM